MSKLAMLDGVGPTVRGHVREWPPPLTADEVAKGFHFLTKKRNRALHGSNAPLAVELEKRYAKKIGVKHVKVVNQGTSALQTAMLALGIGPGDEFLCPAYTYWATALAGIYCNAIPVFVDVDPYLGTLDLASAKAAVTDQTKAVIPVHVYGMPADMDPLMNIAKQNKLYVVEDACQAHGTRYKGRMVGSIGDIGCLSLNRSKQLTGGEGGLLATNDDGLSKTMRGTQIVLLSHGAQPYHHTQLGLPTRTTEVNNALTLLYLRHFEEYNAVRRQLGGLLIGGLGQIPGFSGLQVPEYAKPNWWRFPVKFRPEELDLDCSVAEWKSAAVAALNAEGVPLGDWQPVPVPAQPFFQEMGGYGGTGCPWACQLVGDSVERLERIRANYALGNFPGTERFIAETSFLDGVYPPNDEARMGQYLKAFAKVSENAGRVLEHWRKQQ